MDTSEIKKVLQTYLTACHESSGEKMREAFHDEAHVYGHDEGNALRDRDKEAFIRLVEAGKTDGSDPGFPRQDEILSIDFTGEATAVARVKVRVRNTMFTDVLSLIRLDGKWSIISKLYAGVPIG